MEEQFKLTHKDELIFTGTENECYFKLQKTQSQSADWAMKYEGWKTTPVISLTDRLADIVSSATERINAKAKERPLDYFGQREIELSKFIKIKGKAYRYLKVHDTSGEMCLWRYSGSGFNQGHGITENIQLLCQAADLI